jgi:hypothetical protein
MGLATACCITLMLGSFMELNGLNVTLVTYNYNERYIYLLAADGTASLEVSGMGVSVRTKISIP